MRIGAERGGAGIPCWLAAHEIDPKASDAARTGHPDDRSLARSPRKVSWTARSEVICRNR